MSKILTFGYWRRCIFTFLELIAIVLSMGTWASAQTIYTGRVSDAITKSDLSGVRIELQGTGANVLSKTNGEFVLKVPHKDSVTSSFSFINNLVLWQGQNSFQIAIKNLSGQEVHKASVAGQGHYALPRLSSGVFLLVLTQNGKQEAHKLFSDGIQTRTVSTHGDYYYTAPEPGVDTILLSKEGYYTRKIPVKRQNTVLTTKMLSEFDDDLDYLTDLFDPTAYEILSSEPYLSGMGGITTVKLVYDVKEDILYYANTKKYELHYTFVRDGLGHNIGLGLFNQTQYTQNSNRYLFLGELNYYGNKDIYVLQFSGIIQFKCSQIRKFYDKIVETSFLKDQLYFYSIKPEWDDCGRMQMVSSEELFEGLNYQALNAEKNYGYLRKVDIAHLEDQYLGRRDVVLLNGIPNDISVVAGIITTEFQTPMSHINVLSNSRSTPNMALRDAWDNKKLAELENQLVYINVQPGEYELRKASLQEAEAFWKEREPQEETVLEKDLDYKELVNMEDARLRQVNQIGGKAAQFAEIMNVKLSGDKRVPTPEHAFAIPFYYYHQHLNTQGLQEKLEKMLQETRFMEDPAYRKEQLALFRSQIMQAPASEDLIEAVRKKINYFTDFPSYRFRSSTNAEDLEEFSGAGLYDSESAKKDHPTKTIEKAIKSVWASLWDWRAFEERSYFKINHLSCAMGILVHRSFPDEDANGVVLTTNLYNNNRGIIINAQYKEHSIVFPEPGIIHDQIMVYMWSIDPDKPYTIEYLTFSNVKELNGKSVLTDEEINELTDYCVAIKKRFYYDLQHSCECSFDDFTVDIEFKVDSDVSSRKIYIKQARLYKN